MKYFINKKANDIAADPGTLDKQADKSGVEYLLISSLITLAIICGMLLWGQGYFVHDELTTIDTAKLGSWWTGYDALNAYKPRLLSNAACALIYRSINDSTFPLLIISGLIHLLTLLTIYQILTREANISRILAGIFTLSISISRFNIYVYAERNLGIIEGLSHLLFILSVYFSVRFMRKFSTSDYTYACLTAALCAISHERFTLVLLPIVAVPLLFFARGKISPLKLAMLTLTGILCLSSFLISSAVTGSQSAFSGTSGSKIALLPNQVFSFVAKGTLNAGGLNTGEPYLAGARYSFGGTLLGWALAIALIVFAVLMAFNLARNLRHCIKFEIVRNDNFWKMVC
jgi:hypothetical protein